MTVLEAIDRELQAFRTEAGAPRPLRLGCTTVSHDRLGFCSSCPIPFRDAEDRTILELLCWRLLALRDAETVPRCKHAGCEAEAKHRATGRVEDVEVEFGLCDDHYAPLRPDLRGVSVGLDDRGLS